MPNKKSFHFFLVLPFYNAKEDEFTQEKWTKLYCKVIIKYELSQNYGPPIPLKIAALSRKVITQVCGLPLFFEFFSGWSFTGEGLKKVRKESN
jgi:hypothetical protein